jgi:hypothetical protein
VVVVGTELYRRKYDNKEPMRGFVVAEGDLIGTRMIGTEQTKETVLPALLAGTEEASFPPLLHGRIYSDFRNERTYFTTVFVLILSLYSIPTTESPAADLFESLRSMESKDEPQDFMFLHSDAVERHRSGWVVNFCTSES